jgi:hypothetical protein
MQPILEEPSRNEPKRHSQKRELNMTPTATEFPAGTSKVSPQSPAASELQSIDAFWRASV